MIENHKLWNIVSTEKYISYMQVLLECCCIQMESSQWENLHLFFRKVVFLTGPRRPLLRGLQRA